MQLLPYSYYNFSSSSFLVEVTAKCQEKQKDNFSGELGKVHFIRIKDEKLCFYVQFVVRTHYEKVDNLDRIT